MTDVQKPKTLDGALAAIAPLPSNNDAVTARQLGASMAARAYALGTQMSRHPYITGPGDSKEHIGDWLRLLAEHRACFIAAMALRGYTETNEVLADTTAQAAWSALVDGAGAGEWAHLMVKEYGIDPERIVTAANAHGRASATS